MRSSLAEGLSELKLTLFARNVSDVRRAGAGVSSPPRSEEHTSEVQSPCNLVCRLLLEKKKRTGATTLCVIRLHFRPTRSHVEAPRVYRRCRRPVRRAGRRPATAAATPGFFFFNDTATTEIYTLSLHDALPI